MNAAMPLEATIPIALPKALTGISGFDEITLGGLPVGRPTLVCGAAGCGKTLFAVTFLVNGATRFAEPGVFMSFEERAGDVAANVASLGYNLDELAADGKLAIDHVQVERSEIEENGEYDLEGLFVRLGYAVDQIGAKRVVLDTIETLFSSLSNVTVLRSELRRLFAWLKDRGLTTVITGERGDGQLTRQGLEEYVSDCVVLLDNRVQDHVTTRRLRIPHPVPHPVWRRANCQPAAAPCACRDGQGPATLSPLCDLIPGHVAPERLYLEARWASPAPYAAAADLLADVLPVASGANAATLRQHVLRVAERAEGELGKEQSSFIDGCPAEWAELPIPEGRITVGLDGGYVRDWDYRKANFELIVGRSMPEDRAPRYIGLVHGYDRKPKRRLFEVMRQQGLQANQDVTFLTDGGEEVRALTELVTPEAEHVLDWFHIAMRLTVLEQYPAASLIMTRSKGRGC